MTQLVIIRQRIKTISTIKKVTSAMRMIARSFHSNLHHKKNNILSYENNFNKIFAMLQLKFPSWTPNILLKQSNPDLPTFRLYVIIGAQKGLCATFEASLIKWTNSNTKLLQDSYTHVISIGKKITRHIKSKGVSPVKIYENLSPKKIDYLTDEIYNKILNSEYRYHTAIIVHNQSNSIFNHKLKIATIFPILTNYSSTQSNEIEKKIDYLWSHEPKFILDKMAEKYFRLSIYISVFNSFLGEYAARFVAMNGATKNAKNLLDSLKLQYNKLRQAKITKELAELTGSYQKRI